VTFPLNFCPGVTFTWTTGSGANATTQSQTHITPDHVQKMCVGTWGIVIKEWEVITEVSQVTMGSVLIKSIK
jgi:hypothetical protein